MGREFDAGLRRLRQKMTRDIPQKAKSAAKLAVVQGATEIANLQQNLAPYDDGALHDSIVVTPPGGTTPPYSQPGGSQVAREGQAIITAGNTDVRYAHLVEYGTAPHLAGGMFEGAEHPGTTAQPFFFPAWRALRTRAKSRITRAISKAIKDGAT
jgi:HK97 gp10 family phage protein